jgi:hypothetical protein
MTSLLTQVNETWKEKLRQYVSGDVTVKPCDWSEHYKKTRYIGVTDNERGEIVIPQFQTDSTVSTLHESAEQDESDGEYDESDVHESAEQDESDGEYDESDVHESAEQDESDGEYDESDDGMDERCCSCTLALLYTYHTKTTLSLELGRILIELNYKRKNHDRDLFIERTMHATFSDLCSFARHFLVDTEYPDKVLHHFESGAFTNPYYTASNQYFFKLVVMEHRALLFKVHKWHDKKNKLAELRMSVIWCLQDVQASRHLMTWIAESACEPKDKKHNALRMLESRAEYKGEDVEDFLHNNKILSGITWRYGKADQRNLAFLMGTHRTRGNPHMRDLKGDLADTILRKAHGGYPPRGLDTVNLYRCMERWASGSLDFFSDSSSAVGSASSSVEQNISARFCCANCGLDLPSFYS